MYAVYRDGFRCTPFGTLEESRNSLPYYKGTGGYYQLSIYRQNPDGSLSWIE